MRRPRDAREKATSASIAVDPVMSMHSMVGCDRRSHIGQRPLTSFVDPLVLDVILDPTEPAAEALAAVARGERPPALRLIVPPPAVSFGRLDALRPGYDRARAVAARHGFAPLLRAPGGHAAAYHEGCLVVEEIVHEPDAMPGVQDRFRSRGERLAGALRDVGVDARVGEVPGEYCAGRYSVNARGAVKLVGTAQRVVRGGWLFGA